MTRHTDKKLSTNIQKRVDSGEINTTQVEQYYQLVERIEKELLPHKVITDNQFTKWFEKGQFDLTDLRHFVVQFSVFSNLFLEAQLKKVINAPNLEAMHTSKEILLNELGVVFKNPNSSNTKVTTETVIEEAEKGMIESEGTVEGGTFRFAAAHFEWLVRMGKHLNLKYSDMGKRQHGTKGTLFFCDELSRLYGSADGQVGLGASFAVENWAAAGFWKELINGLKVFRARCLKDLPIGFFTWHDMIEDQHAAHTWDELQDEFFGLEEPINQDKFINSGNKMLEGVLAFWEGLNEDRLKRDNERQIASAG